MRRRKLRGELLENRRLLAVDLQIEVDDSVLAEPGDHVTRVVRIFNNGGETASDVVVRSALSSQLEEASWMRQSGWAKVLHRPDLPELQSGEADYLIQSGGDYEIHTAEPVGDINGDGIIDVAVIGSGRGNMRDTRHSYVVFGGQERVILDGSPVLVGSDSADEPIGFELQFSQTEWPTTARPLGDVNGDGVADLAAGNFVVFGGSDVGSTGPIHLDELDGSNGFALSLEDTFWLTGAQSFDLNGDGIDDILARKDNNSAIVWGGATIGASGSVSLTDLAGTNNPLGIVLPFAAWKASGVGDLNGDGFEDLAFDLARETDLDSPTPAGDEVVRVLLGGPDVSTRLDAGQSWFSIRRPFGFGSRESRDGTLLGPRVQPRIGGDVNGDGIDDLLVVFEGSNCGGCTATEEEGRRVVGGAVVVLGRTNIGEADAADGLTFRVDSPYRGPRPDAHTSDLNGDGILDVVLTADSRKFVIFGGNGIRSHDFDRGTYSGFNGQDGYALPHQPGPPILDVNGDGISDRIGTMQATWRAPIVVGTWLGAGEATAPTLSDATGDGSGDINEVVDIPAGESLIYFIRGQLKADAANSLLSTVLPTLQQLDEDLSDNVHPRQEAVYLDVDVQGKLTLGEASTIEVTITNHGSHNARSVAIEETISDLLQDPTWTLERQVFPEVIDSTAWPPDIGPLIEGEWYIDRGEQLGDDTGRLGDINGDGFEDFYAGNTRGLRVFWGGEGFGNHGTFPTSGNSMVLADFTQANALGDIDGDGYDDFFVVTQERRGNSRDPHIVLGQAEFPVSSNGFRAVNFNTLRTIPLRNVTDSSTFRPAGDVNGDGLSDLIAGSRIVLGQGDGFGEAWYRTILVNTDNSVVLDPRSTVRPLGDVNGDGFSDLLMKVLDGNRKASVYVLFGGADFEGGGKWSTETSTHIRLFSPTGLSEVVEFADEGHHDINGDGIHDIIFSDMWAAPDGAAFVVYGRPDLADTDVDVAALDGANGFALVNGHYPFGQELTAVDINGDGFDDVAVSGGFQVSVYFGGENAGRSGTVDVLGSGFLFINGEVADTPRLSLTSGMDINQDGIEDLLVGEPVLSVGLSKGRTFFVLGRDASSKSGRGSTSETVDVPVGATLTYRISGLAAEDSNGTFGRFFAQPHSTQVQLHPESNNKEVELDVQLLSDIDGDGAVAFSDFLVLSANFGKTDAKPSDGDLDGDGAVGLTDFLRLAADFGKRL